MIIKSAFGSLIRENLKRVWDEEFQEMSLLEFFMSSVDLGKPIFALQDIKYIPRWKSWLLKLLRTRKATDEGSIICFKYWRGTVYIVGVEDK